MNGFLSEVANTLYRQYGAAVSELNLVFPSKRARLFFNKELQNMLQEPLWSPRYLSIDDMVEQLSPLARAHELRLLTMLYKVYSRYHTEDFDTFYYWGQMLLSDFDTVDKYMVDARMLYSNIADLRQLDALFVDPEGDDRRLILEFWRTFNASHAHSVEQSKFLEVWNTLFDIYSEFSADLRAVSLSYSGMQYRQVASTLRDATSIQSNIAEGVYCFVGFNALSTSEQVIFDYFKREAGAHFFWDYDRFYTRDSRHQAGLFLGKNIARYGEAMGIGAVAAVSSDNFARDKHIEAIGAPSDIMQCKVLYAKLEEIYHRQGYVDKETAVVLTDENLLIPVLHSIPEVVQRINITMGYPLSGTVPYVLVERLLELQLRRREEGFYYRDIIEILSHPYLRNARSEAWTAAVRGGNSVYVDPSLMQGWGDDIMGHIFTPVPVASEIGVYLLRVLEYCLGVGDDVIDDSYAERCEFITTIIDQIVRLDGAIAGCEVELTRSIYVSLLRRRLQGLKIPYLGEPLGGLQVMGILETRCLDFKNVIFMSVTDDNFPGSIGGDSYIPASLRQGFHLPTVADHEAVYAYYFYRAISRCSDLTLLYCSTADGLQSGEPSRYIYQLDFQSPHKVLYRSVTTSVTPRLATEINIEKSAMVTAELEVRRYSPSQINCFVECPLKFYFTYVERIKVDDELEVNVSKLEMGNLVHKALEILYTPILVTVDHQRSIRELFSEHISIGAAGSKSVSAGSVSRMDTAVDQAIVEILNQRVQQTPGQGEMIRNIARKYVRSVVEYDARYSAPFRIQGLEQQVQGTLAGVSIAGVIDRLDRMANGDLRVVDYKTGPYDSATYEDVESLFGLKSNKAVLQTMIYSMILAEQEKCAVAPAIYACAKMYDPAQYSPYLNGELSYVNDIADELNTHLQQTVHELKDTAVPFVQTTDMGRCSRCDYRIICKR